MRNVNGLVSFRSFDENSSSDKSVSSEELTSSNSNFKLAYGEHTLGPDSFEGELF